ncbi:MAG: uncharacterized protein KVP18_002248 [Porospora cf. gigantea A]|uniref:uncharacterized protein n=1 Tax=Porospora cf. gigantea A TaxID=2853593 RepID=UPI003559B3E2|nr:MAG: hypothetical protein KVP18_002248 [Porospora cf. gigantea A]
MSLIPSSVDDRWRVGRRLGAGSFGEIYAGEAVDPRIVPARVAIKFEAATARHRQLLTEAKVYKLMRREPDFGRVHWFGHSVNHQILVMDLHGKSLEHYFKSCDGLSLTTSCMLTLQMIQRLETLHAKGVIHRDVKPENFLLQGCRVVLIDFGLAKRFKSAKGLHIPFRTGLTLTGTARYASLNAHEGHEQCRRDDLESALLCLIYFVRKRLPWQQLVASTKEEKYAQIRKAKRAITMEELCKGLPSALLQACIYVRGLGFTERPDYQYIRRLLSSVIDLLQEAPNPHAAPVYDWELPLSERQSRRSREIALIGKMRCDTHRWGRLPRSTREAVVISSRIVPSRAPLSPSYVSRMTRPPRYQLLTHS